MERCRGFDELLSKIAEALPVKNKNALVVYDITLRIGAFLGLAPKYVYLHAGTAEGAKHLGINGKREPVSKFPDAFHRLRPWQLEDCLCIYKDALAKKVRQRATACR